MINLPTRRSDEEYKLNNIRMLIYGREKIGKSTFASHFEKAVFLCTEKAHKGLKIFKIDIRNWREFLEAVDKLSDEEHEFKTVVIDTFDNLFRFCLEYVCTKHKIEHPSDAKWGKGWDLLQREIERPILQLSLSDMGIIFISQMREAEIKTRSMTFTKTVSTLPSQGRKIIMPFVDIIGCCTVEDVRVGKSSEERRVMIFEPSEYMEAGDRTGLLPNKIPLKYKEFVKYFE